MRVQPITCLRPAPDRAAEFASLPYDVFTDEEARAYVAEHPTSFLAIDRPETSFEPGHDPHAPEVYKRAQEILRERQLDGTLVRDETPCMYLYELTTADGHRQTGVLCAIAADDYLEGSLRKHELTLAQKEADRVKHITTVRAQTGPVFVAYRDSVAMDVIVRAAKQSAPLYDFVAADGVHQRVWRIAREVAVDAISVTFATVETAYIADGHHRAAAATAICEARRAEGRENDPAEAFLAVLFPASQLRILPYDRIIELPADFDEDSFVRALKDAGFACAEPSDVPVVPQSKGTFGMYVQGTWREVTWLGGDAAGELDVAVLQEKVLAPLLGIADPRTDERAAFVGGVTAEELERRAGNHAVAFAMYPTSMDELMAVADAGGIMPPKSTWFDPKLQSGLAIRRIW
ncbi:MAG: DUF1015 domain-containing protein [Atopobiaceae bacterium]|nr:DUF1015 domain-containing protein [Atopobiaceae bacterium]